MLVPKIWWEECKDTSIIGVRIMQGVSADTDHSFVRAKLRENISLKKMKGRNTVARFNEENERNRFAEEESNYRNKEEANN